MNALPDSVLNYYRDTYVKNAVDRLLNKADQVDDLSIDNGLELNKALFLARQTQFEYVNFLYSLSKELFSESFWKLEGDYCTPKDVWEESALGLTYYSDEDEENGYEMYLYFHGSKASPELFLGCACYLDEEATFLFAGDFKHWEKKSAGDDWDKHYRSNKSWQWEDLRENAEKVVNDLQQCVTELMPKLKNHFSQI